MKIIKESGRFHVISTGINSGQKMTGFAWTSIKGYDTEEEAEDIMDNLYYVLKTVETCHHAEYIDGKLVMVSKEYCHY